MDGLRMVRTSGAAGPTGGARFTSWVDEPVIAAKQSRVLSLAKK